MTGQTATVEHLNLGALSALPDDAPVAMLNLMRFRDHSLDGNGSGWDAYLRYSALAIKTIKARGGTIVWTGTAKAVALGPAEANRMTSPDYARANLERENGCAAHTILAVRETYNKLTNTPTKE